MDTKVFKEFKEFKAGGEPLLRIEGPYQSSRENRSGSAANVAGGRLPRITQRDIFIQGAFLRGMFGSATDPCCLETFPAAT